MRGKPLPVSKHLHWEAPIRTGYMLGSTSTIKAPVEIPAHLKPRETTRMFALVSQNKILRKSSTPLDGMNAEVDLTTFIDIDEHLNIVLYEQYQVTPDVGIPFCLVDVRVM